MGGKDGGSGCKVEGVYKKKMILGERGTQISERKKKKKKVTIRTLREESE